MTIQDGLLLICASFVAGAWFGVTAWGALMSVIREWLEGVR